MRARVVTRKGEAGFSMVEMLMTALVLSIGLLGLAMLQAMSLRASRGSRSLSTAVEVASGVMDSIEMEGRLSTINLNQSGQIVPPALAGLVYLPIPANTHITQNFNQYGDPADPANPDPTVSFPFYKADISWTADPGGANGNLSDFTVIVTFADTVNGTQAPVTRAVTLTRRIQHG